jgi:hypothetical protein
VAIDANSDNFSQRSDFSLGFNVHHVFEWLLNHRRSIPRCMAHVLLRRSGIMALDMAHLGRHLWVPEIDITPRYCPNLGVSLDPKLVWEIHLPRGQYRRTASIHQRSPSITASLLPPRCLVRSGSSVGIQSRACPPVLLGY